MEQGGTGGQAPRDEQDHRTDQAGGQGGWAAPGSTYPDAGTAEGGPSSAPGPAYAPVPPASGPTPPGTGQQPGVPAPPPGYPPYGAYSPEPGIVPLRPLDLGAIFAGGFKVLRFNPRATMGFSLLVNLVAVLLVVPVLGWVFARMINDPAFLPETDTAPDGPVPGMDLGVQLVSNLAQVPSSLITFLAGLVLCVVVSRAVVGERVTVRQAWREARPSLWRFVGLGLLLGLGWLLVAAVVGGVAFAVARTVGEDAAGIALVLVLLPLVPAAVWVSVRLSLAGPCLVLEQTRVVEALRRSWALSRGQFWRLLGIQVLQSLVVSLISGALIVPVMILAVVVVFATVAGAEGASAPTAADMVVPLVAMGSAAILGGLLVAAITTPFSSAVSTLLYVDQRMRKEGLDVQLAQHVQARGAGQG